MNYSECQKSDWTKHSLQLCSLPMDRVGFPFVLRFKRSDLIDINQDAEKLIRGALLKLSLMSTEIDNIDEAKRCNFELDRIDFIVHKGEHRANITKIDSKFENLLAMFTKEAETSPLVAFKIQMKWNNSNLHATRMNLNRITTIKSNENVSQHVDLNDCLRMFTQPEKLTSDNPWYCSRCKKHQEATKQMNLWKLPKYLIVSLKRIEASKADGYPFMNMSEEATKALMKNSRFSYLLQNRFIYNKLNTMVKFPMRYISILLVYLVIGRNEDL